MALIIFLSTESHFRNRLGIWLLWLLRFLGENLLYDLLLLNQKCSDNSTTGEKRRSEFRVLSAVISYIDLWVSVEFVPLPHAWVATRATVCAWHSLFSLLCVLKSLGIHVLYLTTSIIDFYMLLNLYLYPWRFHLICAFKISSMRTYSW